MKTKHILATLAIAAASAAGISSASAADVGYQDYLHNLDAANPAAEQAAGSSVRTDSLTNFAGTAYDRYQRWNGFAVKTSDADATVKTAAVTSYEAYLINLGSN
jgi:hypothetical protein